MAICDLSFLVSGMSVYGMKVTVLVTLRCVSPQPCDRWANLLVKVFVHLSPLAICSR